MHECNAMQLLKAKEKNTKTKEQRTMVRRKSNEAQGPRKTRQIRDTKSHQLLDEESQTYFYQEVW